MGRVRDGSDRAQMSRVQHRSDRRSRSAAHLFLASVSRRRPRGVDRLLTDILDAVSTTTIRREQIREPGRLLFGYHHPDGTVTINEALLRVTVFLHEMTHHVRPDWSERAVRRKTLQLLHALSDDAIATVNRRVLSAARVPRRQRLAA
jgi:hypothetical protein